MINSLFICAMDAALHAGEILKNGFGTSYRISSKESKNNLVTEYDHKSEKAIIEIIRSRFPDHKFLAEESGKSGSKEENIVRWVIDPLDGTVNFAHTIPIFSVSIAAELNGEVLVGVIYNPITNEIFSARKGEGAFLNGKPIRVSNVDDMSVSMLVTGFPYNVNINPCNCIDHFVSIIQSGIPIRRLGSAALDLAYVAAGRFDGFWEVYLKPWDVAAGMLIVQEAGGLVTQYDQTKFSIFDDTILATNGKIHSQISSKLIKCHCGR